MVGKKNVIASIIFLFHYSQHATLVVSGTHTCKIKKTTHLSCNNKYVEGFHQSLGHSFRQAHSLRAARFK